MHSMLIPREMDWSGPHMSLLLQEGPGFQGEEIYSFKPFAPMAEVGGAPHPSQGGVMAEVGSWHCWAYINGRFWRKLNFLLWFTFVRISPLIIVQFEKFKNWQADEGKPHILCHNSAMGGMGFLQISAMGGKGLRPRDQKVLQCLQ